MRNFFRLTMIILNIFVAVSLILACLCSFVSPKIVWWIGFFGLAYIYLLAFNICFLFVWLFSRKKKMLLISLIPILIGWTFIGRNVQLFGKSLPEEEMDKSFKVLSLNVLGFGQVNWQQPDGTMLNVFDFLRDNDPDIICVQEFINRHWTKDMDEKSIRRRLNKTPYCHMKMMHQHFGVATFSKNPIIRGELVYADSTINVCICSDMLIGSDTVRVYNIHLKSIGFQSDEKSLLHNVVKKEYGRSDARIVRSIIRQISTAASERAKQVEILVSHIERSPYPVIICGDFNDPPTSYSYRKVRGTRKDAFVEAGSGRITTFDIGRIASLRIDNILYSDVFKAYNYESPRVVISDHFPVMCRLVKRSDYDKTKQ